MYDKKFNFLYISEIVINSFQAFLNHYCRTDLDIQLVCKTFRKISGTKFKEQSKLLLLINLSQILTHNV